MCSFVHKYKCQTVESKGLKLEIESLNKDNLEATNTASAQISGSKFHSPLKGTRPVGKMSDSKAVTGKVQEKGASLKGLPLAKSETI